MTEEKLKKLLRDVQERKIDPAAALEKLRHLPYENLGFARVDHHRGLRSGMPEFIFCEGKTPEQIAAIVKKIHAAGANILATRLALPVFTKIRRRLPAGADYNPVARTLSIKQRGAPPLFGGVAVATAGTSDIPVAEEAALTAEILGSRVERLYDVGVAGLHRLLDKLDTLRQVRAIVVAAGMDGALPSVIGGLVERPVIAVPTSVGYGASFKGLSALLAMLNSCAAGVAVVNIDNGFGAGCMAHKINRLGERPDS